MNASDIYVMK